MLVQSPPFPKASPAVHLSPSRRGPLGTRASSGVPFPTPFRSLWKPPTCQPHVHLSRWVGAAGRSTVWGPCALEATKQKSRFERGSGMSQSWAPAAGRARWVHQPPDQAARECGEKSCRDGIRRHVDRSRPREPWGLDSGCVSQTRAPRLGGSPGRGTRAGRDGDLPGRGKMRAQSEAALLGWTPCSAPRQETRKLWKNGPTGPEGPAMAAQGGATALRRHPCHKLVGCLSVARLGGSSEAPPLAQCGPALSVSSSL